MYTNIYVSLTTLLLIEKSLIVLLDMAMGYLVTQNTHIFENNKPGLGERAQ